MSCRVGGTSTSSVSGAVCLVGSSRFNRYAIFSADSFSPMYAFVSATEIVSLRKARSGYCFVSPLADTTSQYSTVNCFAQCVENMQTSVSRTMRALVRSVAVHSMNTFFVWSVIFE